MLVRLAGVSVVEPHPRHPLARPVVRCAASHSPCLLSGRPNKVQVSRCVSDVGRIDGGDFFRDAYMYMYLHEVLV